MLITWPCSVPANTRKQKTLTSGNGTWPRAFESSEGSGKGKAGWEAGASCGRQHPWSLWWGGDGRRDPPCAGDPPQLGACPVPRLHLCLILILGGVRETWHLPVSEIPVLLNFGRDKTPQVKQLDGFANYRTSFHDSARHQEVQQNVWIPKRTSCPTPPPAVTHARWARRTWGQDTSTWITELAQSVCLKISVCGGFTELNMISWVPFLFLL